MPGARKGRPKDSGGQLALWRDDQESISTERDLAAAALALGAAQVEPWSSQERELASQARNVVYPPRGIAVMRELIRSGQDPLGVRHHQIASRWKD
jgi:hypothetical protein